MKWKDLGNPYPHPKPAVYSPARWAESSVFFFQGAPRESLHVFTPPFASLVGSRQTRYGFGIMSMEVLGDLFALTCKVRSIGSNYLGFPLSSRPAPSAGAIHPIHLVVHMSGLPVLHRYDPFRHALVELETTIDTTELRRVMNEVVDSGDGVLLMFVAEPGMTEAKYENPASLVWRDAGVLQGYFSMSAEALGLHFAPLGVTGDPWVSKLVSQPGLIGVGVALVGMPAT